eukprot:12181795-Heterocapsa_arctica.AAC.1
MTSPPIPKSNCHPCTCTCGQCWYFYVLAMREPGSAAGPLECAAAARTFHRCLLIMGEATRTEFRPKCSL